MLSITTEAGLAIAELAEQSGVGDDGGLRLQRLAEPDTEDGTAGNGSGVTMSVAALANEDDLEVTEPVSGCRVFLDQLAAEYTDNMTLDAVPTVEGVPRFELTTTRG